METIERIGFQNVPELRVGTLDSLLSLSDDLLKSNAFIEAVSHKIRPDQ